MIQLREISYSFDLSTPVTLANVRDALSLLFERYNANPAQMLVSAQDFKALIKEISGITAPLPPFAKVSVFNEATGSDVRVICAPELCAPGDVLCVTLCAKQIAPAVESGDPPMIDAGEV